MTSVGDNGFRYFQTPRANALQTFAFGDIRSVFFPESRSFIQAMQQYRAREYRAAADSFAEVANEFEAVRTLPNNPASHAAFFEIECLRLLGDYDKMSEKLGAINNSGISRENELRQLELNRMWEAVGRKAWDHLESLVSEHANTPMPCNQRAQVAYCSGLLLEHKGKTTEAITAYNEAMIIDAAASEVIFRMAALAILRIHDADPDVKEAQSHWGSDDLKTSSPGYAKLLEAGAVARIYEVFAGGGSPIPDPFKAFLDYHAPGLES